MVIEVSRINNQKYKLRITKLRERIQALDLDGFIVPRSDKYQNEFIQDSDERLRWLTGFSGSAGTCLVTESAAFIFVDGRYTTQVQSEVDKNIFKIIETSKTSFNNWLQLNCQNKQIGFDPWLHTVNDMSQGNFNKKNQVSLVECVNLVDEIWKNQPKSSKLIIEEHPITFSGSESKKKRLLISNSMKRNNIDVLILTKPDSICWLLNIRGKDLEHTPIVQSMALLYSNSKVNLFIRDGNVNEDISKFLGADIKIVDEKSFCDHIKLLGEKTVQIDPKTCPIKICGILENIPGKRVDAEDPCNLSKAKKNRTEILGCKTAHLIDGSAFINFLHWFYNTIDKCQIDEILIKEKLKSFREATGKLEGMAFESICGMAENAAIIHYRVTEKTNKKVMGNNVLLLDSGGQYKMGTTDLTRTIAIGKPTRKMIDSYTRVLKGLITISALNWPAGLAGKDIDSLARKSLWSAGLDYEHGTGHGIGSYLSVHEGPHGISRRNNVPLSPGMLVSNEPGYYKPGEFGIRIENVLLIKKSPIKLNGKGEMLTSETLSLAPIDKNLIDIKLLTHDERKWLNSYHKKVEKKISPLLDPLVKSWLQDACSPI